MVDLQDRPATRVPAQVDARVRRARRRTTRTAWVLRLIAIGYVLALVALPVASVVQHTFADGLAPVWRC